MSSGFDILDLDDLFTPFAEGGGPVSSYTLVGPNSGFTNSFSDWFTVTLGEGTLAAPVTITPNDGAAPGSFTPASVVLSDSVRSADFRYTPTAAGSITIAVTDSGGLTDPPSIAFTATDFVFPVLGKKSTVYLRRPTGAGRRR